MESMATLLGPVDKYGSGVVNWVFAHGSGIGMKHEFMQSVALAMSAKDSTVYLF
tara:strand:- start:820 stop:981 length:162 start_codon:yes stop_codon:yes gene_type:complete